MPPFHQVGKIVSSAKGDACLEWEEDKWQSHDMDGKVLCRFLPSSRESARWAFAHKMTKAAVHVTKAASGAGGPSQKDIKDAMTWLHR